MADRNQLPDDLETFGPLGLFLEIAIVDLGQGAVEDPEKPFVENIEAQGFRRVGAVYQAVGQ